MKTLGSKVQSLTPQKGKEEGRKEGRKFISCSLQTSLTYGK